MPTLLMIIFGLWTVKNVRDVRRRRRRRHFQTTTNEMITVGRVHILRSQDRQLIRMLIIDILAFIVCKFPSTMALLYLQITQNDEKSVERQIAEFSIILLTFF
ncbi:hypothetical protein I4U23_012725 [Adineta vaga]|nr:hypothetical protein I4U23_012725 [Adineta vaga]